MFRIIESPSAAARLSAAKAFVERFSPDTEILIVGASRGAADDFARAMASARASNASVCAGSKITRKGYTLNLLVPIG